MVLPQPGARASNTPRFTGVATKTGLGAKGLGTGRGLGKGIGHRRHRKIIKDTIRGITRGDIRRLARRGGVKRISKQIYDEMREVMRSYMEGLLKDCVIFLDHADRKTITVTDVIFALKRALTKAPTATRKPMDAKFGKAVTLSLVLIRMFSSEAGAYDIMICILRLP
ncbi:MAG: hypothetical protein M1827_002417 [Pycnora praestabilis]|nr:MAG: hypothetical protein M1827_002417 [Pycnora praestabilis]